MQYDCSSYGPDLSKPFQGDLDIQLQLTRIMVRI